nr:hypothetical protein [Bovine gammaherpesvirus 4]
MGILDAQVLRIRYLQSSLAIFYSSLARAGPPEYVLCPGWLFCAYIGRPQFGGCVAKQTSERGCNTRCIIPRIHSHNLESLQKVQLQLKYLNYLTTC